MATMSQLKELANHISLQCEAIVNEAIPLDQLKAHTALLSDNAQMLAEWCKALPS